MSLALAKFGQAVAHHDVRGMLECGDEALEKDFPTMQPFMRLATLTNLARAYAVAGSQASADSLGASYLKRSLNLALDTIEEFERLTDADVTDPKFSSMLHTGLMPIDSVHWALKVISTLTASGGPQIPGDVSARIERASKRAFRLWPNGPANP